MSAVERALVATSKVPSNSGHSLHKGTPREAFIRQFLEGHLSANVDIGTGEIIDSSSKPSSQRNQFDIVIYKKNFPKLDFGGGVSGFLIESVIATIEVKSQLDSAAIDQSVKAACAAKKLRSNLSSSFSAGWLPPKVLNFVVAYSGPASMKTAYGWMQGAHSAQGVPMLNLTKFTRKEKLKVPSTSLDGVFVLEKGFIHTDNFPISLNSGNLPGSFLICDTVSDNLLLLFLMLQLACSNIEAAWLNPVPYLSSAVFPGVQVV